MTKDDIEAVALAIAKANGHPDPEAYAKSVVEHHDEAKKPKKK